MDQPHCESTLPTEPRLERILGLPSAVMLVVGGMVGVGIFINPGLIASKFASPGVMLSAWIAGGTVAVLGSFVYAELAGRMPVTGGEYVYFRDCYGELSGFLFGWGTFFAVQSGSLALASMIFATNISEALAVKIPLPLLVIGTLGSLGLANCYRATVGNWLQLCLGAARIVVLLVMVMIGLWHKHTFSTPAYVSHPSRQLQFGVLKYADALVAILYTYGGWQTANFVVGEIRHPAKNMSSALVIGVCLVVAIYLSINISLLNALGFDGLRHSANPTTDLMKTVSTVAASHWASGFVALSSLVFMSQSIFTGPRVYLAMAQDGLFMRRAANITKAGSVPSFAVFIQIIWASALALSQTYAAMLSYVVSINFIFFSLAAAALFLLRRGSFEGFEEYYTGYKVPFHPWTTALFIILCLFVVSSAVISHPGNSLLGIAVTLSGLPFFYYWKRRRKISEDTFFYEN